MEKRRPLLSEGFAFNFSALACSSLHISKSVPQLELVPTMSYCVHYSRLTYRASASHREFPRGCVLPCGPEVLRVLRGIDTILKLEAGCFVTLVRPEQPVKKGVTERSERRYYSEREGIDELTNSIP